MTRTFTRLALASTAFIAICLQAQQPASNPATSKAPCAVKRTIRPDGTLEVQNADCTTTRTAKKTVLSPPAQDSASPNPTPKALPTPAAASALPHEIKPEPLPADELDPQLRSKYLAATGAYYDYFTAGYRHRQQVFDWQLVSSHIIFFLVTLLVCSGVYFAALQFHEGMRRRAAEAALASTIASALATPPTDNAVTTFSASATGIAVSSPVLGVIILVISLAFFYLYLVYVYPITELF